MKEVKGFMSEDGQFFFNDYQCAGHERAMERKELKIEIIDEEPLLLNMSGLTDIRVASIPDEHYMEKLEKHFEKEGYRVEFMYDKKTFGEVILIVTDVSVVYVYEPTQFFAECAKEIDKWTHEYAKYKKCRRDEEK